MGIAPAKLPEGQHQSNTLPPAEWVPASFHMTREKMMQKLFTGCTVTCIEGRVENLEQTVAGNKRSFACIHVDRCTERVREIRNRAVFILNPADADTSAHLQTWQATYVSEHALTAAVMSNAEISLAVRWEGVGQTLLMLQAPVL